MRETSLLQLDIVVRIEVVDPDDLIAALKQSARRAASDKPCRSGYKNLHVMCLSGHGDLRGYVLYVDAEIWEHVAAVAQKFRSMVTYRGRGFAEARTRVAAGS